MAAAFASVGFGLALLIPTIFAMSAKLVPENRAGALSFVSLLTALPRILAPLAFGLVAARLGTAFAFGLVAADVRRRHDGRYAFDDGTLGFRCGSLHFLLGGFHLFRHGRRLGGRGGRLEVVIKALCRYFLCWCGR